ncbi:kinesin-like protein KIF26B isoform 2-T2 [Anableps anableps]
MSSVTGRGQKFPAAILGTHRSPEVQHHCDSGSFSSFSSRRQCQPEERPTPEGSGGPRADPHRNMCQRASEVPSYKSLPGSLGERIRMSFGSGTMCRGSALALHPGSGRSDRKVECCEKCSAALVALKKQALSLAVHHHFSSKETSDLSAFLHDNLRAHGHSNMEFRDRERELGQCGSCGANLNQLKQEAILLALSRGQSLAKPPFAASLSTGTVLGQNGTKHGDKFSREVVHPPYGQTHSPRSPRTPQRTPQTLRRRGPKLPNPDMDRWVEEQQQLVASKSVSNPDGVTMNSHHQKADDATLTCGEAGTIQTTSKIPHISRVVTIANTAAMSLLARAAEKLNLTLRKKGQASDPAPSNHSTCFREIVQKNPPPVPPCLLQAAARSKDSPDIAKVKVVLRVSRLLSESHGQPPVLRIDPSRKRVTIMDPVTKNLSHSTMTLGRERISPLKSFNFDAAYSQDSGQAEVCAGVLADVIRCVLSGSDGCVLGLGCADVASWSSMVGSGDNLQKLGLIPCAISWLYSAIERRREKTWTDLTVSVSAIELCCGEEDTLRDLLGEVVPSPGSVQGSPKAHIKVTEDPVNGIQLRNHNRVKAPTAERAASLLDAAIAARRHTDFITYLCHSSIMFFTLYVQPPRTESSTIGKGSRGTTKLTMIDVCSGMRGVSKNKLPHSDLGPIVLALLSRNKNIPNKSSKLAMLLRESMPSNCHVAVIGQVADSLAHLQESFATIQLASRIRRTQKRTKSTSCSPCGRSLTKDKKSARSLALRAFHSTEEVDVEFRSFRLRGELYRSSSDQSCDTVIQINSDGLVHSKAAPLLAQPEFVPIIPSLHPNNSDLDDPEFTALLQELLQIPQLHGEKKTEETVQGNIEGLRAEGKPPERDCLKCDTFAELQERLGCIDGSEVTMEVLKSSLKGATLKNILTKRQPQKEAFKAPHILLNVGKGCAQASFGEKQTDSAVPADSFQREDSGLFDCEECSANSSSEELMNQALGLTMTCSSELPKARAVKSGNNSLSKCLEGNSYIKAANCLSEHQPLENHEAADWIKPDKRASPIGKSSPISPSSSCSSSHSMAKSVVIRDDNAKDSKEMKATITVTVQQPLDKMGQDELVFSVVEEVTISGAYDSGNTGGNIICIREPAQEHGQTSTSAQPIRIIGDLGDDCSATASPVVQPVSTEQNKEKAQYHFKRETRSLPSFINPMLMNMDCDLDDAKEEKGTPETFKDVNSASELKRKNIKSSVDNNIEKQTQSCASRIHHLKTSDRTSSQTSYNQLVSENKDICKKALENKMCEKRLENTEKGHPRDCKHVYSTRSQKVSEGIETACRQVGSNHKRTGVSPGCYETMSVSSVTGSLPRTWQNPNHRENLSRGVTSSTPCSPGETLERRHGRRQSTENYSFHTSSPQKYIPEVKQDSGCFPRKGNESFFTSSPTRKHDNSSSRHRSPADNSSRLFNTKLEQLARRTNSLGRTPRDFPTMERGSSNTSVSSKESSKGSNQASRKASYKENYEGDCTFPRANRSPRRNPRSDHSQHFFHTENPLLQSTKHSHSKLSAVGKLKITTPKVRRQSSPSIKNLNVSHKSLQYSSRSASLSPDSKMVSFERTSSFFPSSPPRSHRSISRTPSQSSTCSSTKSAIQGIVNGRITDLLRERSSSPSLSGPDQMSPLLSPYSQMTAPRTPDHLSGHASDTTSVLSGDLPPAMGKTSLHFSNRSSLVSSGYDSLVRDSEATGSSTSNRDSVSDRSGSLLSVTRSSRSSRRRGNTGTHQRRLSHDTSLPIKRSASGLCSRWMEREIPEAYEIKVYEIDNVQRMQKRAGADKQGLGCFSAKLRFLEHRQQRISDVRVKYNRLRRELEHVKYNLMLEPAKWNQEFDLWQTFEVDSLEHLEALEEVTARLENRVNLCKASIMMVTCFDASTRRRRKNRRRKVKQQRTLKQF